MEERAHDALGREHACRRLRRVVRPAREDVFQQVRGWQTILVEAVRDPRCPGEPVRLHRVVAERLLGSAEPEREREDGPRSAGPPRFERTTVRIAARFRPRLLCGVGREGAGVLERVGVVHREDLHVLGEPLLERDDWIRPNADRVHLVRPRDRRLPGELPDDHVHELVREDLVHGAEAAGELLAAVEIHVAGVLLPLAVEDEPEAGKSSLVVGQREIRGLRLAAFAPGERVLVHAVHAQEPARVAALQDGVVTPRVRRALEDREAVLDPTGVPQDDEERELGGCGGDDADEQDDGQDEPFHGELPMRVDRLY